MRSVFAQVIAALLGLLAAALPVHAFDIDFPVRCELGRDCWIQQHVDHDKSSGAADFQCGSATYDGHDGTDIRVRDTTVSADVLAVADGVVKGTRDGMPDKLVSNDEDRKAVANRECGNGVVIRHETGFETQYCHMKSGTVAVKKGDTIARGQALGKVGYSGSAAFPHVHLTLRKTNKVIDPFSGSIDRGCEADDTSMWSEAASKVLAGKDARVLRVGLSPESVDLDMLEHNLVTDEPPAKDWPALIGYAWLINLKAGDTINLAITGPSGEISGHQIVLDRAKAQYMLRAGKKRASDPWPAGNYRVNLTVTAKDGKATIEENREFAVN